MDPRILRTRRLENEYSELMKINGKIIKIEPIGSAPYEQYRVTFNIRTIISPAPVYRSKTVCRLTIPFRYPEDVPKIAVEPESMPAPWHPNWYKGGTWCFGTWTKEESLANYLYRCASTIQFNAEFTDARTQAAANKDAVEFWNQYKNNSAVLPCDRQRLPTLDADAPKIVIKSTEKPKITFFKK